MAQVCYRHPDRETGVSCASCDRPICTDCMTPTPVGMRCPECARERTKVVQGPDAWLSAGGQPVATYGFIALSCLAYVGQIASGGGGTGVVGLMRDGALFAPAIDLDGEWWRIVTSGFLHFGPIHLLLNMFLLYVLGTLIEPMIGTARFIGIYIVSLLAGSLGALLMSDVAASTAGASGAVYGLFAATFLIARDRGMESIVSQIGLLIVLNLVFTFSVPNISVGGHIGGLVGGAVAAILVIAAGRGLPASARGFVEYLGIVALAAVAAAGSLWAANQAVMDALAVSALGFPFG